MKSILVSACLLGTPCRYDGDSRPDPTVCALSKKHNLIPVCPEVMGGLPTPRVPSEIVGDRVLSRDGRDVTKNYREGAEQALQIALSHHCEIAILKERSPSCGCGRVYSGSFDGTLIDGDGVTAALLKSHGICVLGESMKEELAQLLTR